MSFTKGIKELQNDLKKLSDKAEELDGTTIPLTEVMTDSFIQDHSTFQNFDDLIALSGFKAETQKDFDAIPDDEWDSFIDGNTDFSNWQEMIDNAGAIYARQKLGF